jgi:hypothetical protein
MRQANKDLRVARGVMFLVGLVTIVANLIFYFNAEENVARQVDKELGAIGGRANVAPEKKEELRRLEEEAVQFTKIASAVFTTLGVLYLIFGCWIKKYPVATTVTALVLFITGNIVSAVFDPEMILKGIVIKICGIAALAKSIQAAIAFETERKLRKRRRYREETDLPTSDVAPEGTDNVHLNCPHCGQSFALLVSQLDRRVQCEHCGELFRLDPDLLPSSYRLADTDRSRPGFPRRLEAGDEQPDRPSRKPSAIWIPAILLAMAAGGIGGWLLLDNIKWKPDPPRDENKQQAGMPPAVAPNPKSGAARKVAIDPFPIMDRLKAPPNGAVIALDLPIPLPLPALPKALVIEPPMLEKGGQEYKFTTTFDAITIGGGGRYLIFRLPKDETLAIFDVSVAKVVKQLPLSEPNAQIAAGMNHLMIALPKARVIERWSLHSFEREASALLPFTNAVLGLCMGSASDGPLLLCERYGMGSNDTNAGHFLDIRTLRLLGEANADKMGTVNAQFMRAAPNGRVFAWRPNSGTQPHTMRILVLRPEKTTYKDCDFPDYLLAPGTDGRTICCIRGVMDLNMNLIAPRPQNNNVYWPFVPAVQGPYFLQLLSTELEIPAWRHNGGYGGVVVYESGSYSEVARLASVEGVFDMKLPWGSMPNPIAYDQRILFIPKAKLLVNIPKGNNRIMLRRLDIEEELEKSGKDYLLILSEAPRVALLGAEFQYQIQAKAKRGGIKYRLDSGPSGMTISDGGLVRWRVPNDFSEREVKCIVSVADSAGSERTQSIQIDVSPNAPLTQK